MHSLSSLTKWDKAFLQTSQWQCLHLEICLAPIGMSSFYWTQYCTGCPKENVKAHGRGGWILKLLGQQWMCVFLLSMGSSLVHSACSATATLYFPFECSFILEHHHLPAPNEYSQRPYLHFTKSLVTLTIHGTPQVEKCLCTYNFFPLCMLVLWLF